MGGNAFKMLTRRYQPEEYFLVRDEVVSMLDSVMMAPGMTFSPPSYFTKPSFGDLDVVVNSSYLPTDYQEQLISLFSIKPGQFQSNGDCFSFVYRDLQVDLIKAPNVFYPTACTYFSYNDIWNLIGRLGHKIGVKVGHAGLALIVRPTGEFQQNHVIGEVILSRSILEILPILGLSRTRYNNGFTTLEDMFEYVASSKFFNPDIFLLDNRSSESRRRDRTRKTYAAFLDWIEAQPNREWTQFQFERIDSKGGYSIREPYYSELIVPQYPNADDEVNELIAQYERRRTWAGIFNGNVVTELTGLTHRPLGMFMKYLRTVLAMEDYIDRPADVPAEIVRQFQIYTGEPK